MPAAETAESAPPPVRAEDIPLARRIGALAFLLFGYFFYAWSWNTVDVLRPYIREDLGLTLQQAGSLYSIQALAALAGAVINGQLADRFGRRNALIGAMAGYGLSLAAGAMITDYAQAAAQRFALGYFAGSMFPIAVGLYSGLFDVRLRGRIAGVVMFVYNIAVSAQGVAARYVFEQGWHYEILLWAGLIPAAGAILALALVPDDRRMRAWGASPDAAPAPKGLPVWELFHRDVWRQTLLLACMVGLNFFAYQAFSGWATTYLREMRGMSDADIGSAVGWQFFGAALGGFVWGWVGDRFGRRASAPGFFCVAGLVAVYLYAPLDGASLLPAAFAVGLALSASVVWGPWLAELYPPHLRSTAASIFNWGRIISFTAPMVTAAVAETFGLETAMALAIPGFLLAAVIWVSLPETVKRRREAE